MIPGWSEQDAQDGASMPPDVVDVHSVTKSSRGFTITNWIIVIINWKLDSLDELFGG